MILEQVYDPLQSCPPPLIRRYQRTAELARLGRVPQAAKLKCLDCCGWEHAEAKACAVSTCPLWLVNRRIFAQTPTRKDAA